MTFSMNSDCESVAIGNGWGTIQSGAETHSVSPPSFRDRAMADREAVKGNDQRREKKEECWVGKADGVRKFMGHMYKFIFQPERKR